MARRAASASLRLHAERVATFVPGRDLRIASPARTEPLRSLAARAAQHGQRVLHCDYGPHDLWADGTPRFRSYVWWQPARATAFREPALSTSLQP